MAGYVSADKGRQVTSRQVRVLHVRGAGYVTRIDDYVMADGSRSRRRLTGARRMGTRDFTVSRFTR